MVPNAVCGSDSAPADLVVFAERARVLDEAAGDPAEARADGLLGVWVPPAEVLAAGRLPDGFSRAI